MAAARLGCVVAMLALAGVASVARGNVLKELGKDVRDGVAAAKQPVEEAVVSAASSQCQNVKKILGVAYEQIEDEVEPDLNKLNLEFRTRVFKSIYQIDVAKDALLKSRDYKRHDKLVVFIHGFTDDPSKASFSNISESFLERGGYNVLALDGSPLIRWLYLRSTTYIQFMGEKLGEALAAMVDDGLNPNEILIVGHSLGSHVAGFTGKTFHNITGKKIGRISSLDPAGPCFSHVETNMRLKKSDAKYVDVIHTDAGVYGLKENVGHTDYYVNGGSTQPECFFETCSHSRAWLYYSESVVDEHAFPAKKCKDWSTFKKNQCGETEMSYMGFASKPGTNGVFYLRSSGEYPYGLGAKGLIYEDKPSTSKKAAESSDNVAKSIANASSKIFG